MFNSTPWFACNKEPCYFYSSHQGQVIEATKNKNNSRDKTCKSIHFLFLPLQPDYCTVNIKEIINELLYMIILWISAYNCR